MKVSVIIPFYNEGGNFDQILNNLNKELDNIDYEIIFINDFSTDESKAILEKKIISLERFKVIDNQEKKGLGGAIRTGILNSNGEYVAVMMCDLSDSVLDLKKYYFEISKGDFDAVLGTRFSKNSDVKNYPKFKYILNRIFNLFVKIVFLSNYNDFTNAFKMYKKKTLINLFPIISEDFNIFLEIPLKVIYRNYKYKIIPISWHGRKKGKSKFKIKELRSKYVFTLIYCFFEKLLLKR